jgi:hypothetical protein
VIARENPRMQDSPELKIQKGFLRRKRNSRKKGTGGVRIRANKKTTPVRAWLSKGRLRRCTIPTQRTHITYLAPRPYK